MTSKEKQTLNNLDYLEERGERFREEILIPQGKNRCAYCDQYPVVFINEFLCQYHWELLVEEIRTMYFALERGFVKLQTYEPEQIETYEPTEFLSENLKEAIEEASKINKGKEE